MITKKLAFLTIFLLISFVIIARVSNKEEILSARDKNNIEISNINILKASNFELPDSVFTFTAPQDTLNKLISLEEEYLYYISVELVTPHDCTMKIAMEDPSGAQFNLFENDMYYEPEHGRSFEIPFGTAQSGVYNISFSVDCQYNLNIHVKIEKAVKCLHDKMSLQDIENIIFYEVTTFDNDEAIYINHDVDLKENVMYKIYIGRVSAISKVENSEVKIDLSVEDPNDISFSLFSNNFLAGVNEVNESFFGTSINGSYALNITIHGNVEYVNVAYAIVEDYLITDDLQEDEEVPISEEENEDSNQNNSEEEKKTEEKDTDEKKTSNSSGDSWNMTMSLPEEMMVGTVVSVGSTMSTLMVALFNHRKKMKVKLG